MIDFGKVTKEYLALGILIIVIIMAVFFGWHKEAANEARVQKAIVMSHEEAKDKNVLQNTLDMSKQNAQLLANFISQAQEGKVKPVADFMVQAPSIVEATKQVVTRINGRDLTLPATALAKSDNTIVSTEKLSDEQQFAARNVNEKSAGLDKTKVNEEYQVAVYKNNNYRNWEWSIGYGQQNGEGYIPVGLQRNYSKDKAVVVELHLDTYKMKNITGWEVKQVWKTDKLLLVF